MCIRDRDKIKFTYMEQKEYETIDDDIEELENRVSELDEDIPIAPSFLQAVSPPVSYTHLDVYKRQVYEMFVNFYTKYSII